MPHHKPTAFYFVVSLIFTIAGIQTNAIAQSYKRSDYEIRQDEVKKPMVLRSFIVGGPARAISVGTPEGIHYCFDASNPRVVSAWSGDFLDIGPDRGYGKGRGGKHAKVLGKKFDIGDAGFPFLINGSKPTKIEFLGYRTKPYPEFYYSINDSIKISQLIKPDKKSHGLEYHFSISGASQSLNFKLDDSQVVVSSNKGNYKGGLVTLTPAESTKFTISVHPKVSKPE